MEETIFNIFPIYKNEVISKVGYKAHTISGTDEEKVQYLKAQIESDMQQLYYATIPSTFTVKRGGKEPVVGISLDNYNNLLLNSTNAVLFEEVFALHNCSNTPLFVVTLLVDGKINVDESIKGSETPKTEFVKGIKEEIPKSFIDEYFTDKGFEIDRLLNDDFLNASKVLFREGHYVSSAKLLVSAIDTIAFLEYGDVPGNFKMWIYEYCDLEKVNVTKDELWEYRNSILHMTNSTSRKVLKKEIAPLTFYVGNINEKTLRSNGESKFFNLTILIDEFAKGLEKWANSFNVERSKFEGFINRYETIISDSRYRRNYFS